MITNTAEMPLGTLVGELFGRATRRRGLVVAGWGLAIASHAAAAVLFASHQGATVIERTPPPVDVEFVTPPEPPPPPPVPEEAPPEAPKTAPPNTPASAPPAAARAGALHTAAPDAAPAQQTEEAVDFTTDPNGKSYGGGVVAVGGSAAFGAAGARVSPVAGNASSAPATARPGDGLTAASNLSRKPRLPGSDPCRGFFPGAAQDDVGDVAVMVTIAKSGRVSNTQLLSENPRGQGFGGAARTCLASQSFVPALDREGNAAATAIRVNLRFSR
jgi:hypothetical protein